MYIFIWTQLLKKGPKPPFYAGLIDVISLPSLSISFNPVAICCSKNIGPTVLSK
jgi:hypothetical protein